MQRLLRLIICSIMVLGCSGTVTPAGEQAVVAQVATATAQAAFQSTAWKRFGYTSALNLPLAIASRLCIKAEQNDNRLGHPTGPWLPISVALNVCQDGISTWVDQQFHPIGKFHFAIRSLRLIGAYGCYLAVRAMLEQDVPRGPKTIGKRVTKYSTDVALVGGWSLISMMLKKLVDLRLDISVPYTKEDRLAMLASDVVPYAIARLI